MIDNVFHVPPLVYHSSHSSHTITQCILYILGSIHSLLIYLRISHPQAVSCFSFPGKPPATTPPLLHSPVTWMTHDHSSLTPPVPLLTGLSSSHIISLLTSVVTLNPLCFNWQFTCSYFPLDGELLKGRGQSLIISIPQCLSLCSINQNLIKENLKFVFSRVSVVTNQSQSWQGEHKRNK